MEGVMSHLILTSFCFLFLVGCNWLVGRRTDEYPQRRADDRFARAHRVVR